MNYKNVVLDSFGYALPPYLITSEEIENELKPVYDRLKLPQGRLELQTGIKSRGYWDKGTRPSFIATTAAESCLEKSQIKREEIDLLIFSSVCRDFLEPATASVVHHHLKLSKECINFDLSNACLGLLSGMDMAARMIENGQIRTALIVSGENGGPLLWETIKFLKDSTELTRKTIKKYVANLTIGSAGAAVLISHKDISSNRRHLLGSSQLSNTTTNNLCQGSGNTESLMMETNSEELLHAGIELAVENWERTKKRLSWENSQVDKVICHQVGDAHRNLLYDMCKLDKKKDYSTFEYLGNTGSAALPVTMMIASEKGFLKENDRVALLGIGSGLNSLMMGVSW